TILCYAETIYRFNGLWEGPDPLNPLISLFLIQLMVSVSATHVLSVALKPFNQPPFVTQILGGIILGPSVLGRISPYRKFVFPTFSFKLLEAMAHLSISLYAFLIGLKMDIRGIFRTGPKQMKIAVSGIVIPFCVGSGLYFAFQTDESGNTGWLFWGGALTVTGYSTLTKILERQQLLHTEIGKTAAGSALMTEFGAWGFLAVAYAVSSSPSSFYWAFISSLAFVFLCVNYVRPGLSWIIKRTPEGQGHSEFYLCSMLIGSVLSGVVTDLCGTHPMIGTLVFGLVVPSEVLETTLVDKLENFVEGLLLPVYFVVCGLRVNVDLVSDGGASWFAAALIVLLACTVKLFSAAVVIMFSDELSVEEASAVGMLASAKGVAALFILEAGQIQGALSTRSYSIMMVAVLIMTLVVAPAAIWFRPAQQAAPHKRRTIQKARSEEELRIVACIHGTSQVPPTIDLLRASYSTTRSPLNVCALQLVELVGRASTMLISHNVRGGAGPRNPSHTEAHTDHIIAAFDDFELQSEGVRTAVMTARSPYATMDEDICTVAGDKRAALIVLPFHKQLGPDGEAEDVKGSIRTVNEGVLEKAPCSVAILVDRGMIKSSSAAADQPSGPNIAMLFLGGADDREALSYAWRMAGNRDARLSVVRLIAAIDVGVETAAHDQSRRRHMSLQIDGRADKQMDEDFLSKFKLTTMDVENINYTELVLNDEEEAIKAIKSMDENPYNLYLVGRGSGLESPLTSGLADWCDCPELGPIGDLLVTSEFESSFSVVVVQQYV
ncbi:hypothetical protein M569_15718, partial [Genlisea aurea]